MKLKYIGSKKHELGERETITVPEGQVWMAQIFKIEDNTNTSAKIDKMYINRFSISTSQSKFKKAYLLNGSEINGKLIFAGNSTICNDDEFNVTHHILIIQALKFQEVN